MHRETRYTYIPSRELRVLIQQYAEKNAGEWREAGIQRERNVTRSQRLVARLIIDGPVKITENIGL